MSGRARADDQLSGLREPHRSKARCAKFDSRPSGQKIFLGNPRASQTNCCRAVEPPVETYDWVLVVASPGTFFGRCTLEIEVMLLLTLDVLRGGCVDGDEMFSESLEPFGCVRIRAYCRNNGAL